MTQPQDKMRAEFEATMRAEPHCWMNRDFHKSKSDGQTYADFCVEVAWKTWQAACAQQDAQSQQDALDAARPSGISWDSGFLTVVYKGIEPGPEAQELCTHPKASAMSWSHAINDRDAALATQGASNV